MIEKLLDITIILGFAVNCLVMGWHYTHMLQLNSYKGKRYIKWFRNNIQSVFSKQGWILLILLLLPFYAARTHDWKTRTILALILFVNAISAIPQKAKKPLVVTARVKRFFITQALLMIFLGGLYHFKPIGKFSVGILLFWVAFYPLVILTANFINAPIEKLISKYYINDARKMLAAMPDLMVIGITGSYGKTSTKNFLHALLSVKFNVLMTPESYNTTLGVVRTIRENLRPMDNVFIAEMGAKNKGDIKEICDLVHPKIGILTAIGEQHLETFKNIDNIIATKFELVDSLPNDGTAFLNMDNSYIKSRKTDKAVVGYCIDKNSSEGFYKAYDISVSNEGTSFTAEAPSGEVFSYTTKLLGRHNIQNLIGCIAVAHKLGISFEDLAAPIKRLQPVEHRLQLLPNGFIDDAYNSNPEGFKAALDVLCEFPNQRVLVTPGMVELGERQDELNKEVGAYAAARCDYAVLVGEKQAPPLKEGLLEAGFDEEKLFVVKNLAEGLEVVKNLPDEGGRTVLLENDLPDNYL